MNLPMNPSPRMPALLRLALFVSAFAWAGIHTAHAKETQPLRQQLPTTTLRAGMHLIKAEVAQRPQEHMIGLMGRNTMGVNDGMLFIFPQATKQCFWMKNTLIPLQIAFLADDGRVVNLDEMQPQTLNSHCSAQPVRYVLEMNTRWFSKRGIQAGSRLSGGPFDQ
jgi:uncharacterized membrane protein (UPF0127 family)